MVELVGRGTELATVDAVLSRAQAGLAVLRIEGEPGIGKSALLQAAVDRGRRAGSRVLACQAAAAEARLAFAGLADLLEPIVDPTIELLPEPQRVALDMALLRRSGDARPIAPRAVSAGALSLLRAAASEQPLLIAVDDAQWLDRASAATIAYAVRRLTASPVALVIAARTPEGRSDPLRDLDALDRDRVTRIHVGPLSLSATYQVLRARGLAPGSRPALRRIHERSRGNPLVALELARAMRDPVESPDPRLDGTTPETLRALFQRRIERAGSDARDAMLATALAGDPDEALVRTIGADDDAVDGLVAMGVLERDHGRLRFLHPLLAEAAINAAGDDERRSMHLRLADLAAQPERRVRHRALATTSADAGLADELESAAAAIAGTSPETAYELLELAIQRTPEEAAARRHQRSLASARQADRAGDTPGAIRILDALLELDLDGDTRARALEARAAIDWVAGGLDSAIERCDEGLRIDGLDPWTVARLLVTRARLAMDPHDGRRRAMDALAAVDRLTTPDPALRVEVLTALGAAQAALGDAVEPELIDEALALEALAPPDRVADRFSAALGAWRKYQGRLGEARSWLRRTHETALAEGDEGSVPYALSHLPQLELWVGDWPAAEAAAREHLQVAEWTGQEEQRLTALYSLALVDAHLGRLDEVRQRIADTLPAAERLDDWNVYQSLSVLGFAELSAGRPAAASAPLRRAYTIYEAYGAGDTVAVHENLAEALVASGELAEAAGVIEPYLERATRLRRPMGLAASHRALGLLRSADGRIAEGLAAIDTALRHEDEAAVPFSRGRTLLAAGLLRRRAGQRRAARTALDEAHDLFTRLGAPLWAGTVQRELERIPGPRPHRPGALTSTERRIAELVGEGMTNREVAERLYVTPKTVETTLTRIYGKLEVRSRTELAARLRDQGVPDPAL